MDIQLFVQKKKDLNPSELVLFADKNNNTKLVIIYSSIRDDKTTEDYFKYLVKHLKTPFLAVRVSGTLTPEEGYLENSIAAALLSGEIKVDTFIKSLNLLNPEKTAEELLPHLKNENFYIMYSSVYLTELSKIDAVLRRIVANNTNLTIFGGNSSPKPLTATNTGVYRDALAVAIIKGANPKVELSTGFVFDEENNEEYTITKTDEYNIYEIDNKNAVSEYARIQHMRPYFFNTFSKLLENPNMADASKRLAKANPSLYEGVLNYSIKLFGRETNGITEPIAVFHLNEQKNSIICGSHIQKNTKIRRLKTTKESQLKLYENIKNNNPTIINGCAFTSFWLDYDYETVKQKLDPTKKPYLLGLFYGEIATNKKTTNTTHNCQIETLELM